MREIKFRCWFNYRMWYGIPAIHFNDDGVARVDLNDEDDDYCPTPDTWTGADDFVLMQYIGLHDKNGREIYEGDVMGMVGDDDDSRFVVELHDGAYRKVFPEWPEDLPYNQIDSLDKQFYEVIGNRYENPELLESS